MEVKASNKRSSIKGVFKIFAILLLVLLFTYEILTRLHDSNISWVNSDNDNDGIALIEDLDPDGDGLRMSEDRDANGDGLTNESQAVTYAESMLNTPYDHLMGKFDDLLGRAGLVVCIDVPVRSYLNAGVSMPGLLKESAAKNPDWFRINENNFPSNKFFYRRVRNYFDLFKNHSMLEAGVTPRVGDWAFYGRIHIAMVTIVNEDGSYDLIEANGERMRVVRSTSEYMEESWGVPSFFGRVRYGGK